MDYFPSALAAENRSSMSDASVTLLLPALSTGNLGQLATDLIISSSHARKVGYLDDPHVLPCAGNDPFEESGRGRLSVALEVYEGNNDLRIVQQRAPVIKGTMLKFAKNLATWALKCGTKEVIILSGVDAGKRPMQDVGSSSIRYISTANPDGGDERCESLGWRKFEQYLPSSQQWQLLDSYSTNDLEENRELQLTDELYYPSLPFASLFSCCKVKGLNVLCILYFCSEGDNIQDAFLLAEALQNFLTQTKNGYLPLNWAIPHSWNSVYGPPPDVSMFY